MRNLMIITCTLLLSWTVFIVQDAGANPDAFLDEGEYDFSDTDESADVDSPPAPPAPPSDALPTVSGPPDDVIPTAGFENDPPMPVPMADVGEPAVDEDPTEDEPVATPAPKAPKKKGKAQAAKKSKVKAGKGLFKTTSSNCVMRRKPASSSPQLTVIKAHKKIWVETDSSGWFKAFRTQGHGYLSPKCF